MRKYLLATAAAAAVVATPAAARDGSLYLGIEGGVMFPRDNDSDVDVAFFTTQDPPAPVAPAPVDFIANDAFGIDYKTGYDLDAIVGYDFGFFRVEGELGYKRASVDEFDFDQDFIDDLNVALNRPSGPGDPPGTLPALVASDFDLDGHVSVLSGMVNALADFGNEDGLSFYAGGGFGRARVKALGDRDSAWAWQLIAGARFALSPNIDLGLKYRYFRTGRLNFIGDDVFAVDGNPNNVAVGDPPVGVVQTTDALLFADAEQRFRSHSLLASLIFNFGAASEPLPPPLPPPPPPPPPPATQTCPDGSVILATSSCPLPPPPPPPPPPSAGERGR